MDWTIIVRLATIYLLALIGLASVVVIGIAIFLAYRYDITFTIRSNNSPDKEKTKVE